VVLRLLAERLADLTVVRWPRRYKSDLTPCFRDSCRRGTSCPQLSSGALAGEPYRFAPGRRPRPCYQCSEGRASTRASRVTAVAFRGGVRPRASWRSRTARFSCPRQKWDGRPAHQPRMKTPNSPARNQSRGCMATIVASAAEWPSAASSNTSKLSSDTDSPIPMMPVFEA